MSTNQEKKQLLKKLEITLDKLVDASKNNHNIKAKELLRDVTNIVEKFKKTN